MKKRYLLYIFILTVFVLSNAKDKNRKWQSLADDVKPFAYPTEYLDSISNSLGGVENVSCRKYKYKLPFKKKEIMVFSGGWGALRAGYGIFNATIDSNEINIEGRAVTNNFVSAFYMVRDYVKTTIDKSGFYSKLFIQSLKENRYTKTTWTLFDPKGKRVLSNRDQKKTVLDASSFTNDYVTLLYKLRSMNLAVGDTFSINCFVHKKDYPIFFRVKKKESVEVKAGVFNCLKVIPTLVGNGRNFTEKDNLALWLSDDERHILVKGESKVKLGRITAELVYYKRD